MEIANLTPILNDLGMSEEEWEYTDRLQNIYLTTDINQQLFLDTDMIYFDTVNSLIKIKRFESKVVSGKFIGTVMSSNQILLVKMLPGPSIYKPYYRNPSVGDKIYLIESDGSLHMENDAFEMSTITKVLPSDTGFIITVADNIFSGSSLQCMYSPIDAMIVLGESTSMTTLPTKHYRFLNKQTTICEMLPISTLPFDSIFDMDKVSGLGIVRVSDIH